MNRSASSDNEPLRWGVVGASTILRTQMASALRNHEPSNPWSGDRPHGLLIGICGSTEYHTRRVAEELHIAQVYTKVEALLRQSRTDCIYIANHPQRHAMAVRAALEHGKHVLCEMPLALDAQEAQDLADLAARRGLVLALNAPWRADPAVQEMRNLYSAGTIGDLLGGRILNAILLTLQQQGWRLSPMGGGVVWERTQRSIDLLRYITGREVAEVHAFGPAQILGSHAVAQVPEQVVSSVLLTANDAAFQLYDSFLLGHVSSSTELYGTIGSLTCRNWTTDEQETTLELQRHGQRTMQPTSARVRSNDATTVAAFEHAVRNESTPLAGAPDGIQAARIVAAIHESLRSNRPIVPRSPITKARTP